MSLNTCRRCGTCCRKGGPALHLSDADLLEHMPMSSLVCLRRGEQAFDPRTNGLGTLERELLKIRGRDGGWACMYFDEESAACGVYMHRPLECRSLSCSDTEDIFSAMDTPTLAREHVVPAGSALRACIEEHERLFPAGEAVRLAAARCVGDGIPQELDNLIRLESHFRQSFAEKVEVTDQDLWAYFGRPLWLVLAPLNRDYMQYGSQLKSASNC